MHYKLLLEQNGFIIEDSDTIPKKITGQAKSDLSEMVKAIADEEFARYLEADRHERVEFTRLHQNVSYLKLDGADNETLERFKAIVTNKYKIHDHDSLIKLFKTDKCLDDWLTEKHFYCYDAKAVKSTQAKIKLIRHVEKLYGLTMFDLNFSDDACITMEEDIYKTIKGIFKTKKERPTTSHELKQLYLAMLKNVGGYNIINAERSAKMDANKKRQYIYTLNHENIRHHLELNKYKNRDGNDFHPMADDLYKIKVVDAFLD